MDESWWSLAPEEFCAHTLHASGTMYNVSYASLKGTQRRTTMKGPKFYPYNPPRHSDSCCSELST
eukprot:1617217-Amphidinium_carterae.1